MDGDVKHVIPKESQHFQALTRFSVKPIRFIDHYDK